MKKSYALLSLLIIAGLFSHDILAEEYNDPFVPDSLKISDASKDDKDEEVASTTTEIKEEDKKKDDEKKDEDKKKEDKKDEKKEEDKKEESTAYTVVSGDCLSAIAGRFLGEMGRWPELVEANKDKYPSLLSNPNLIHTGWQLTIPGADSKAIAAANSNSGSGSGSTGSGSTSSGSKVAPTGQAIDSSGFGSVSPCTPMPTWVSSEFGYRTHPVTGQKQSFHNAVDLPVPTGTRLNALANGTVIAVGFESGGGNYCTIRYDNGMESFYCHLQSSTVKVGQRVECGQQVAISDNTGAYTTGAHLHCGIKKNGQYVNPRDYLKLP